MSYQEVGCQQRDDEMIGKSPAGRPTRLTFERREPITRIDVPPIVVLASTPKADGSGARDLYEIKNSRMRVLAAVFHTVVIGACLPVHQYVVNYSIAQISALFEPYRFIEIFD